MRTTSQISHLSPQERAAELNEPGDRAGITFPSAIGGPWEASTMWRHILNADVENAGGWNHNRPRIV
jgi:hypothetical protein